MNDPHAGQGADLPPRGQFLVPLPLLAILLVLLCILAVLGLAIGLGRGGSAREPTAEQERATAAAIQKVGAVRLLQASREPRTGEQVFQGQCTTCHASGALGAPKFGDAAAWTPRIQTGFDALFNSALHGKKSMPAQGGGLLSDMEVARGVVYMANAAGARFAEPPLPAKVPAK
jgi:cytochrome c5